MLLSHTPSFCENQKCLQMWSDVSWGQKLPQVENHWLTTFKIKVPKDFKHGVWSANSKTHPKGAKVRAYPKCSWRRVRWRACLSRSQEQRALTMAVWLWCRHRCMASGANDRALETGLYSCVILAYDTGGVSRWWGEDELLNSTRTFIYPWWEKWN